MIANNELVRTGDVVVTIFRYYSGENEKNCDKFSHGSWSPG
jgi:hypothetical protein